MRFSLALLLGALVALSGSAQTRPATYAEFDTSIAAGDGAALKAMIDAELVKNIYLRPGAYTIANPVAIDRASSLFVHCADRYKTILIARDPTQPLFVVRNAPLLNITGCRIFPGSVTRTNIHARAITFTNSTPVAVEFQDCTIDQAQLELNGPGSFRIQNCVFAPGGRVTSPVLLNHDQADALIIGGGFTNGANSLATGVTDYHHAWQKRGRLRIYLSTTAAARGASDFRAETGSSLGPHVIASVRSEGTNSTAISRLLYVPATAQAVDVVIKNSNGAWAVGPSGDEIQCKLVNYNGAGVLWLLGNITSRCGRYLVEGNTQAAQIISLGNVLSNPSAFAVTGAARIVSTADLWNHYYASGLRDLTEPVIRWVNDTRALASYDGVPVPPADSLPPPLSRPAVTAALPGMLDVKVAFGAVGNGVADDTAEIQAALDARCSSNDPKLIFFPAGTYKISDTLRLNHHLGACRSLGYGGWIAGAGSSKTVIAMAAGVKKGTFASDGLGLAAIQGITFRTWKWQAGDPQHPNIDIEAYAGFPASGQNSLYDVEADGGYAAFATGVRYNEIQCDSTIAFNSRFQNAQIGFASGHSNAIANTVYDSEFVNNAYAMAGGWVIDAPSNGGSFHAIHGVSRGTTIRDFLTTEAAIYGTYGWDSDAPAYVYVGVTDNSYAFWFEQAYLHPISASMYPFFTGAGHGLIFLRSRLTGGALRVGQGTSNSYAFSLESEIPDWAMSIKGTTGELHKAPPDAPASLGAPGKPEVTQ